jgi:hypothetical protein
MRAPSVAAVLRTAGLAGTVTGCAMAVAALSSPWAIDGPRTGREPEQSGWTYLSDAGLLYVAGLGLVVVLAIALCVGPRSRRVSRAAGSAAVTMLILALAAVALLWWLIGLDVGVLNGDDGVRQFSAGAGFERAIVGLLVALTGLVVLLAGRWEARSRRALRRQEPPREPSWLSPG